MLTGLLSYPIAEFRGTRQRAPRTRNSARAAFVCVILPGGGAVPILFYIIPYILIHFSSMRSMLPAAAGRWAERSEALDCLAMVLVSAVWHVVSCPTCMRCS